MAQANPSGALTTIDLAAQLRSNPQMVAESAIIDLAMERNDIMDDLLFTEANNGDTNVNTYRTELPEAVWTRIYKGIASSKGSWASSRNVAGRIASKLEVAKDLYDKAPNKDSFIKRHASAHVDAMTQEIAQAIIYGNIKDNPDGINGIMKFYDRCTSNDDKDPAFYCIDAGGTKDYASILLAGWGEDSLTCFYPQGSRGGGIEVGPFKAVDLEDATNPAATYEGYRQYFYWSIGLDLMDWRKCGRICNIDRTAHQASGDLKEAAAKFYQRIDVLTARVNERGVRQVLYMDKLVWEQAKVFAGILTRQNAVTEKDLDGHLVRTLNGRPVRINDAMNVTETKVVTA